MVKRARSNVTSAVRLAAVMLLHAGASVPVLSQCELAKLVASDGTPGDSFGWSVAIWGNVAVLGAPYDDDTGYRAGSAYVFVFDGSDWLEQQKLLPSDAGEDDRFGFSVAICGDVVLVGADRNDDNGENSGSVYVFHFDGASWMEQQKLLPSDGAAGDLFGFSVAVYGDRALVGAPWHDATGENAGAAYVFRFDGSTWIEQQKLLPTDGSTMARFGYCVAIADDTAVLGALGDDEAGENTGAAYVFRSEGSAWIEQQKLLASDGEEDDLFGCSVAISGDSVLVGAKRDDVFYAERGSAYVFRFDGSSWVEEQKLVAHDGVASDYFGGSVAMCDGTAVIGAHGDDDNGESSGSAYVFRFDGTAWLEEEKLLASDGAEDDAFGWTVAAVGETAVVADYSNDNGSAYVFDLAGPDCNDNGLCDSRDIAEGTSPDCNSNGVPDECELEGNDCNENRVPDDCDIAGGASQDCQPDGLPDECQLDGVFAALSPVLSPIGYGVPQDFRLRTPPDALGDVLITFEAVGDFSASYEHLDVDINGLPIGSVFVFVGNDCPATPDADQLVVPTADYNAAVAGGDALITMVASVNVDPYACEPSSYITVGVEYEAQGVNDCNGNTIPDECDIAGGNSDDANGNGIPDECECWGDLDGDGDIDLSDLATLLSNYGMPDGASYEDGDLDGDGDVDLSDLAALLSVYGSDC